MLKRQSLCVVLLSAALTFALMFSFTVVARAADKPPTRADVPKLHYNPADELKNYRDRFEGVKLSDEQMKKIDDFIETAETEVKKLEGKDDRESIKEVFQAMHKLREDVDSILDDTQKAALQKNRQGVFVEQFRKRYTAPELKLSDDQTKKINEVIDELKKQMMAQTPGPDERENRRKSFELMGPAMEKLNALLTPEQQKQAQPFGFSSRRPRGDGKTPQPPKDN